MTTTPSEDPAAILLDQARKIVTGARRQTYGTPEDNFQRIADLWNVYLSLRFRETPSNASILGTVDVCLMMNLMKIARLIETENHADSWRDIAGYAACGARASSADLGAA